MQTLDIPYHDMLLYKVHVRGYTMQKGSKVKHRGTFLGLQDKISYWKELGVTSIELMPAYDFDDFPQNYWGYTTGDYFSPKPEYCESEDSRHEVRDFVKALHAAGLECLLDFYFPESCTMELVGRVLRFWRETYEVDGFVLSGAAIRWELLASDQALSGVKLLCAGSLEALSGGRQMANHLAQYNTNFQNCMRRFLRGDANQIADLQYYLRENPTSCGAIHYITNHDGFCLMDLVSYAYTHNEENGEENLDGCRENYSWNCGVEGRSRKKSILALRERQMRNAMMLLLLAQGTPLLLGGDEFGNTQNGNNNPYCQDNEIGWTDWKKARGKEGFTQFVRDLIAFRKNHPILHMPCAVSCADEKGYGYPQISYHSENAWYADMTPRSRQLGVLYCGLYAQKENKEPDDFIYVMYNMSEQQKRYALVKLPRGKQWYLAADSSAPSSLAVCRPGEEKRIADGRYYTVEGRSIVVLIGKSVNEKD